MGSETMFMNMIEQSNNRMNESPLASKTFMYGAITTYWEVFLELAAKLDTLIYIDLGLIFALTLFMFEGNAMIAIITSLSCFMIVIQTYGLVVCFWNFNIFVAATILMTMGMSVEFVCHLAAAFATSSSKPGAQSTTTERLGKSMSHTFPPLLEGVVSTLLGVLPLVFHPTTFVVKYMFGITVIAISCGALNGFVLVPAMLAVFDRIWSLIPSLRKSAPSAAIDEQPGKQPVQDERDDTNN